MPSTLDISVTGIPDGDYVTVFDQKSDKARIKVETLTYSGGALSTSFPSIGGDVTVCGYIHDNSATSLKAAYIEGVTVTDAGGETRYFAELSSSHYIYDAALVFSAGDTFEFDFLAPMGIVNKEYLTDSDAGSRAWTQLNNTGKWNYNENVLQLYLDGTQLSKTDDYPTDGKLHTLTLSMTSSSEIHVLAARTGITGLYNGIMANAVATIGGVTTSNAMALSTGNSEPSAEANNAITYVNILDSQREQYQLSANAAQWNNISPDPKQLPLTIVLS